MTSAPRGRPQASSRETLAEAACELFLEQGYEETSVSDVTRRAGVSRSTFFNYFDGKAATVWFALDEWLAGLGESGSATAEMPEVVSRLGASPPHTLALAIANAETMGLETELEIGRALRQAALGRRLAGAQANSRAEVVLPAEAILRAEIAGAARAAAVFAGIWRWAMLGAGTHRLDAVVGEVLELLDEGRSAGLRQG